MIINACASYNGLIMSLQVILVLGAAGCENARTGYVKAPRRYTKVGYGLAF